MTRRKPQYQRMSPLADRHLVEFRETQLMLLPSKLVWAPIQRTLFVADLHIGKASTFRKAGIAVPEGTTARMLHELATEIHNRQAGRLIVLGDLLHSRVQAEEDFQRELATWRKAHSLVSITLIKGNHDVRSNDFYKAMDIEVTTNADYQWHAITLGHDPEDVNQCEFSMCGHIHPSITVGHESLDCFWLKENQLVLPAFGQFTGRKRIRLGQREAAIAVCEKRLFMITNAP